MAFSLATTALSFAPPTLALSGPLTRASKLKMESLADLKVLADKCNPTVGYFNPLCLGEQALNSEVEEEAAIGFLRHAEIKHGRIAMAAFVGFIVQSNGIHFPWALTSSGISFADIAAAGGPAAQWDALPTASKLQIFGAIFFLEAWGEGRNTLALSGQKHYMKGGKPGFYPSFKNAGLPHEVPLDLWDPFGFTTKMSAEKKEKSLIAEINNGRLAMIGIMAFMAASKGLNVPVMDGFAIAQYDGEVMAPFSASDASLPFVSNMMSYSLPNFIW